MPRSRCLRYLWTASAYAVIVVDSARPVSAALHRRMTYVAGFSSALRFIPELSGAAGFAAMMSTPHGGSFGSLRRRAKFRRSWIADR